MRSKFKWIFTLLLVFTMQFSFAQEKTVTGVVSDASGPLPGVNVVVRGTQRGTATGFDGRYSIKAKEGEVLVFSFMGMSDVSRTVGASNDINVVMKDEAKQLGEVVVQAYGKTTSRAKNLGASQTVTAASIKDRPNVNVLQSLQGQVAGANIATFSGQPGTNKIDVIIRGAGTINASSDPLYVIDGIPLTQAFFRNLNQNEIESVSVLKDAAATAIYGNRGSNGVIVITTKKGSYKKSFAGNYSSSYGLTEFRGDDYGLPTAIEHLKLQQKGLNEGVGTLSSAFANSGVYFSGKPNSNVEISLDPANIDAYAVNTNWKDIFFRTGKSTSHDLSFTVGNDNINAFTAVGYFEQEGVVPTTAFKRFTFRSNVSGKSTNEKLLYGFNVFGAYSRRNQLEAETRSVGTGNISTNILQNPLTGYLASPRFVSPSGYVNGQQLFNDYGAAALDMTPYMLMDLFGNKNAPSFFNETKALVNGNLSYKITSDLTVGTTAGIDFADDKRVFAIGPEAYLSVVRASGLGQPFHGSETIGSTAEFTFDLVNKLNYKKTFAEKHTVDASLYMEYLKAHRKEFTFRQTGLNPLAWVPGAGTGYTTYNPTTMPLDYRPIVSAAKRDAGLLSYFATADYDYDSKYGLAATIRRDGSYRFVGDNKWGTFYSGAVRWNISKENFLANSTLISDLKLRASYGVTGNQNVLGRGVDSNVSTIFLASQVVRDLNSTQAGYGNSASYEVSVMGNPDLKWETTSQFNVGLDFGLLNRLTGSFDVYRKVTDDLYIATPISAGNGTTGTTTTQPSLFTNNGSLENKGVELSLKYDILKEGDLKLSLNANGAYNDNNMRDLGVLDPDGDGVYRVGNQLLRVGGPIYEYFTVPYVGVNPVNGNLLFKDINGDLTETPTDADRRASHKNALPVYQGGFGLNSSYNGFFLDVNFSYALGQYRYDFDYDGLMDIRNADLFPVSKELFNAWTPTNTNTDVPALAATNYDLGSTLSDRFLRDASYVRLRNLSIGYSVPSKFLEKTFFTALKFRVQGENLLTWTKWKGFDPESVTSAQNPYPTPKVITFGLDVNF